MEIVALQNDTVDAICWRVYGKTHGIVEEVLQLNPHIANTGPFLPIGTAVKLPEKTKPMITETINLWN